VYFKYLKQILASFVVVVLLVLVVVAVVVYFCFKYKVSRVAQASLIFSM
jgi:heme/copper-type cytochrome/quinol oxidase subunit 2